MDGLESYVGWLLFGSHKLYLGAAFYGIWLIKSLRSREMNVFWSRTLMVLGLDLIMLHIFQHIASWQLPVVSTTLLHTLLWLLLSLYSQVQEEKPTLHLQVGSRYEDFKLPMCHVCTWMQL